MCKTTEETHNGRNTHSDLTCEACKAKSLLGVCYRANPSLRSFIVLLDRLKASADILRSYIFRVYDGNGEEQNITKQNEATKRAQDMVLSAEQIIEKYRVLSNRL